jgi:TusA-related sulfurtransferase
MTMMEVLDTTGMRAPNTLLKIALKSAEMKRGDILGVRGDSPNFERAVEAWCTRLGKAVVSVSHHKGGITDIRIRL